MSLPTLCSECGKSLTGKKKGTRTCGDRCRAARSVRLRQQHQREAEAEAQVNSPDLATREMQLAVRGHLDDRIRTILDKELAPVIREHITEDVQRSIAALLALTPTAVAAIMDDLTQEDSYDRRQKAYTLLLKYTAGHSSFIPSVDPAPPAVQVVFEGMPRPTIVEAEVIEDDEFECDACHEVQATTERAAPGAERCKGCHAQLQERYQEILKSTTKS